MGEKLQIKVLERCSIIIMIGIIARLPFAFFAELTSRVSQQGGGLVAFLIEIILLFSYSAVRSCWYKEPVRCLYSMRKRIVGNKQYGGVRQYIPLKINAAGVMPITFCSGNYVVTDFFCELCSF